MTLEMKACPRCGLIRSVNESRPNTECVDCVLVLRTRPDLDERKNAARKGYGPVVIDTIMLDLIAETVAELRREYTPMVAA